jgi:hypothetical protein
VDQKVKPTRGESLPHSQLKRLTVLWAQAHGYSACAVEVSLPRCRYRADVAAFRSIKSEPSWTALFECKQAASDLRKDSCSTSVVQERLETVQRRREILEKHLRIHYPSLRSGESLFPEFDSHDFEVIGHRNYTRVMHELAALQNHLHDGTKFEKLVRYRCANLFFLVLPNDLFRASQIPVGWGALVESNGILTLARKPTWHEMRHEDQILFLRRIAVAGTRELNRKLGITFEEVLASGVASANGLGSANSPEPANCGRSSHSVSAS